MNIRLTVVFIIAVSMIRCTTEPKQETNSMKKDPHSYSKPTEAKVTHLSWKASVDFDARKINGTATWRLEQNGKPGVIIFDSKDLSIKKVTLDDGAETEYKLGQKNDILGEELIIDIKPDTKVVTIEYMTDPSAEALQWLSAQQTAGKKFPFLFTQSQAILARSWVPCQDSPAIHFTYDAEVTVPKDLIALMSASNPQEKNASGIYKFEMKQPISSYLLALAVGDVQFKSISNRSGVYAEPSLVDTAAWEFADLEKMIAGAEELYGPYAWERYDVIVLPPSFPFGGMENPRLRSQRPRYWQEIVH